MRGKDCPIAARRAASTFSLSLRGGGEGSPLALLQRGPRPKAALREASGRQAGVRGLLFAVLWLAVAASPSHAQHLSDLEPERPIGIEDARPVSYRAIAGAVDWSYSVHRSSIPDDTGPGLSVLYGALRGLELGAALRYVTHPGRNALQGISSGDLEVHALYGVATESASRPAMAVRLGVQFPTGLDSRGTDLHLTALATRSFDALRLHGNLRWIRLGDTLATERADRVEAAVGVDFLADRAGSTDTILLAGVSVKSSRVLAAETVVEVEVGLRRKVGAQMVFFAGVGSALTGERDRTRLGLRAGLSHVF